MGVGERRKHGSGAAGGVAAARGSGGGVPLTKRRRNARVPSQQQQQHHHHHHHHQHERNGREEDELRFGMVDGRSMEVTENCESRRTGSARASQRSWGVRDEIRESTEDHRRHDPRHAKGTWCWSRCSTDWNFP